MNQMSESREFPDVESLCSGILSKSTSNCSKSLQNAQPRPSLRLENMEFASSGHVFDSPRAEINSSSINRQGTFHSWNQIATGGNTVRESAGKLVVKNEIERRFQRRDLQGDHRPLILSFQQKEWPVEWGPQDMALTGGGGLVRVPNLRVCRHTCWEVAHAGQEGRMPWYRPGGVVSTSS